MCSHDKCVCYIYNTVATSLCLLQCWQCILKMRQTQCDLSFIYTRSLVLTHSQGSINSLVCGSCLSGSIGLFHPPFIFSQLNSPLAWLHDAMVGFSGCSAPLTAARTCRITYVQAGVKETTKEQMKYFPLEGSENHKEGDKEREWGRQHIDIITLFNPLQ